MWERREKKQIDVTRILFNERKGPGKYKANAFPIRVFPYSLALMINNSREFFYSPALPASEYSPGPSSHLKRNPRNFFLRPI